MACRLIRELCCQCRILVSQLVLLFLSGRARGKEGREGVENLGTLLEVRLIMKGTGPWTRALSSSVASRMAVWKGKMAAGGLEALCTSKDSAARPEADRYSSILDVLVWITAESSEIRLGCDIVYCRGWRGLLWKISLGGKGW